MDKKSKFTEVTIEQWLQKTVTIFRKANIASARLDAEIILAHTMRKPRTYLHAHIDETLDPRTIEIANARLDLRLDATPVAYIIGHKEFYGRQFTVSPATLIPRPETEAMVDMVKASIPPLLRENKILVDVGTGSGCIGITLKLEQPELDVTLTDLSQHALAVAQKNADSLQAPVTIWHGDLLRNYGLPIDIICANLPYVGRDWEVSRDTRAEPNMALFAADDGLSLIKQLATQTTQLLTPGGMIFLEADPRQHTSIIDFCKTMSLRHRGTNGFIVSFQQV